MKYNAVLWLVFTKEIKKGLVRFVDEKEAKDYIKKAKPIYKDLLSKVEGISGDNPMASNITGAFIILAVWLASERKLKPADMTEVINEAFKAKIISAKYKDMNVNTPEGAAKFAGKMHSCKAWADNHPEDYETWDFNFDETKHKEGFYYHYTNCPINNFCRKYGYEEFTPVLCNIDYATFAMMGARLIRQHTLAEGGPMCDYWIVSDKSNAGLD